MTHVATFCTGTYLTASNAMSDSAFADTDFRIELV